MALVLAAKVCNRYFVYTPFDSPTERDFKDMLLTNPLPCNWMSCRPTSHTMYGAILEAAKFIAHQQDYKQSHKDLECLLLEIKCVHAQLPPKDWLGSEVRIGGA